MDDSTRTMMLTLASGVIKKGLITLGATAATHGIIASNQTETFVAAGMFLVGAGWSFWNDYGKAIVLSRLEVLKAQSLAQAAKLRNAGIAAPTVSEIAAQHPTLTAGDVAKVADTVIKILIAAFLLSAFLFAPPAMAQTRPRTPVLTGNLAKDIQSGIENQEQKTVSDIETALQKFGDFIGNDMTGAANLAISIPDLQDGNGQICFDAMASASKVFQANPVPTPSNSSNMPPIGVAMVVERIRLLAMTVNNVCNIPACTQIFADATGALSAAAPLKMPLPSLHDLCSNVPNIALAKPTRTLPVTAAAPATTPAPDPTQPGTAK